MGCRLRKIRNSGRPDAPPSSNHRHDSGCIKEDIRRCKDAGMDAHIGKPVELDKLYSMVRKFIN